MLQNSPLSPIDRELVGTIQDESDRMARLVRNLLDMTRMQGDAKLELDWESLSEIVESAVRRTSALFSNPIRLEFPPEPILLRVDGVLAEQAIVNVLENASRHAGRDTQVRIRTATQPGIASVQITDSGEGFESGGENRIFDRFEKSGEGGFGLGLAIVRAILTAHGGTVRAENVEPHGARFTLEWPRDEAPAPSVLERIED